MQGLQLCFVFKKFNKGMKPTYKNSYGLKNLEKKMVIIKQYNIIYFYLQSFANYVTFD